MSEYVVIDIETTGFDPFNNRITAIGVKRKDEEIVFMEQNEYRLLLEFWEWASKIKNPKFIGFNCFKFDFRFIHLRSMLHNIEVPFSLKDSYIDLQYELKFYGGTYMKGNLCDYCRFIEIGEKNGDGGKAVVLWNEQRLMELKDYCLQDIKLTWKLFERCMKAKIFSK